LNQSEQAALLDATDDADGRPRPGRRLALAAGLHGLRTDEIVPTTNGPGIIEEGVRQIGDAAYVLEVADGKTVTSVRELPLAEDVARDIFSLKRGASKRQDEPLVDVNRRTVRNWIYDARDVLDGPAGSKLSMHDLQRTWATQTYYSLAIAGVPIAEELVMSWGGWAHTSTGRETFRQNYLGPVPDSIVRQCVGDIPLSA